MDYEKKLNELNSDMSFVIDMINRLECSIDYYRCKREIKLNNKINGILYFLLLILISIISIIVMSNGFVIVGGGCLFLTAFASLAGVKIMQSSLKKSDEELKKYFLREYDIDVNTLSNSISNEELMTLEDELKIKKNILRNINNEIARVKWGMNVLKDDGNVHTGTLIKRNFEMEEDNSLEIGSCKKRVLRKEK